MSDRASFLRKSRLEKSCDPTARPKATSGDFGVVQQRAEQAAKFFHSVGLPNGDLPKEAATIRPGSLNLSRTPSNTHSDTTSGQSPSRRQLSLVFPPTYDYGSPVKCSRPTSPPDVHQIIKNDATSKNKVLQRKDNRKYSLSKSPDKILSPIPRLLSESIIHQECSNKFKTTGITCPNAENIQRSKEGCLMSSSRTEENKRIETNNSEVQHFSNKVSNSLTRVRSHLYDKQRSKDRSQENKSEFKNASTVISEHTSRELSAGKSSQPSLSEPSAFDRLLASSSTESSPRKSPFLQRQRSSSDSQSDVFVSESKSSQSYDFTDGKFLMKHLSKSFASASSLSEVDKRESSLSRMSSFGLENQKNEIETPPRSLSPASKLFKKSRSPTPKTSPKTHRRFRNKHRSKSDVPEHKVLLNRMQSEGDVQALLRQEELIDEQERKRRHHFAHYDWQSMMFCFQDVLVAMETLKRKITLSGASQAAALVSTSSMDNIASKGSSVNGSQEDISMYWEEDEGLENNKSNDLVASCPFFRNEVGGEANRIVSVTASSNLSVQVGNDEDASTKEAHNILTNHTDLSIVENDNCDQVCASNLSPCGRMSFGIELVDKGATYYRTHFFDKEHQNLFGVDERYGPIVISFRREKLEDEGYGVVYQYRIIVRTCELCTLRGSILEDVIQFPRQQSSKGIPAKDVLEYVCPEINISCLKLAAATPKVNEQLMKVDEQNLHDAYKVGILYCQAGQVSEEDMYSNEHGSEAFNHFLALMGDKVKLCGFEDFRGGLDVRANSTGTESVFTTFQGHKIMFHVSTLLPYSPNNKQQVLRKRHIGNDITTIIFQEPGSEPFNPKHVRSHFQHIFVIVRVHNPGSDNTCYSVAVARSSNIPRFGPPIPENSMFPSSSTFRDFLLTKLINGENTACTAGKFKALAMNTRAQYLSDLALDIFTQTGLEGNSRFGRFSISTASRRIKENKEKSQKVVKPEYLSYGALTWHVTVDDYSSSEKVPCILGMSECFLMLIEKATKQLMFSIPCQAVLGWTVPPPSQEQLKTYRRVLFVYYGRGERITMYTNDVDSRDEITMRLERFTKGSETINRELRRDINDELGFRVNYEGIVVEVEPNSYASVDGLRQSSRLVEICKVPVVTKTHEEIIHLLKTIDELKVVVVPPNEDGTPRKCSMELYHLYPVMEFKKVDLASTLTLDIFHSCGEREPIRRVSERSKRARSEDDDTRSCHAAKYKPEESTLNSPLSGFTHNHSPKIKVQQPILKKIGSREDTEATLTATASRLALVGVTSSYVNQRTRAKGMVSRGRQSYVDDSTPIVKSPTSTMRYVKGDANSTKRKEDEEKLQQSNSYNFQPSPNSSNNSSYISISSHNYSDIFSSSNHKSIPDYSCGSHAFQRNQNNNNNNNNSFCQMVQNQTKNSKNENINIEIPKADEESTCDQNHSFISVTSSLSRKLAVDKYAESRSKKSFRNRSFSHTPVGSYTSICDFQNSLISSLPFESYSEAVTFNQMSSSCASSLQKNNRKASHKRKPSLPIQAIGFASSTTPKGRTRRPKVEEDVIARQMNIESTISTSFHRRQGCGSANVLFGNQQFHHPYGISKFFLPLHRQHCLLVEDRQTNQDVKSNQSRNIDKGFEEFNFESFSMRKLYDFDEINSDAMGAIHECAVLPVEHGYDDTNKDGDGFDLLQSPCYGASPHLGAMSPSRLMTPHAKANHENASRRRNTVSAV